MSHAIPTTYPRACLSEAQVAEGYRVIRGRSHGFNWKPIYRVTVEFESEVEAREFLESLGLASTASRA